jgi:hypothetical protein
MQRSRRKKIVRFLLLFLLLLLFLAYFFRYSLIFSFQYSRLQSLCENKEQQNCFQKLWVHRVNTLERYGLLEDKFAGFELDVVYNESTHLLEVHHEQKAKEGDTLLLSRFFQHVDLRHKRFWLDIRMGSVANMHNTLLALSQLDTLYHIRDACIAEVYDVTAAELFAASGYTVALNVIKELDEQLTAKKASKDSIDQRIKGVKYISRDGRYLASARKLFPGKPIITWRVPFSDYLDRSPIRKLLDDPMVDVILVNIKTHYYR